MAARERQRRILRHPRPAARPASASEPSAAEVGVDTIVPLAPRTWTADDDPDGADKLGLSTAEIVQFKQSGFVVKRNLVPRAELDRFVEECWRDAPPPLQRADTRTWSNVGDHWAALPDPKTESGRSYRRLVTKPALPTTARTACHGSP